MNINEIVFGGSGMNGMMGARAPESAKCSDSPSIECEQPDSTLPKEMPIAMLYVPYQSWRKLYDHQIALERGTIFEELDKPFIGERLK